MRAQLCIYITVLAALTGCMALPVHAATATANVMVSVNIRPWMKMKADQHVNSYRVTKDDLAKGYVDIPGLATVNVKTNEKRDVLITVAGEGEVAMLIKEAGSSVFPMQTGTLNIGRQAAGDSVSRQIDCRVILPSGSKEGFYPLALRFSPRTY